MAYNGTRNNNYNNNRKGGYNRDQAPRKPRKETFKFKLIDAFTVNDRQHGTVEIDKDEVLSKLQFLQDQGIFTIMTTNVNISNEILREDGKRGNSTVGFIEGIDTAAGIASVSIYGTSVERMKQLTAGTNFLLEPKVLAYNGEFKCFNGFNLIPETLSSY